MANDPKTPPFQSAPAESGSHSSPPKEPVNLALSEMQPNPTEATPAESSDSAPPPQSPGDARAELATITQTGNTNRLSPGDEDRATRLMRDCLLEGGTGTPAALEAMPLLPWILGVRAIENAWPNLPAASRTEILDGLTKMETENGYRLRLSVARALSRMEPGEAIRVAAATCQSMWNVEAGSLKPEHSKLVGNVFIGRGKPWVLQLPLADLPDPAADAIVSAVVYSTFNVNNPPITQLSVLRYAGGRLGQLHANLQGMVARGVARWNGKWQSSLRKEVADLPESILSALKPERGPEPRPAPSGEPPGGDATAADQPEAPISAELQEKLRLAAESGDPAAVEAVNQEIDAWREAEKIARLEALDDEDEEEEDSDEEDEAAPVEAREGRDRGRRGRKDRPAYVSREQEARGGSAFNYGAAMKQLDNYVAGLRNELATAQSRLRRLDEGGRPRRESADRPVLTHDEANLSPDELKRLVIQLEARTQELKARVEELTTDSETRAIAMAAGTADASPDAVTQLRTLLALKLQDDYADFLTLQKESPDAIVQQHYPGLIQHVFEILLAEQIPLRVPEEPAASAPPLPTAPV